jgi:hypothetical protein
MRPGSWNATAPRFGLLAGVSGDSGIIAVQILPFSSGAHAAADIGSMTILQFPETAHVPQRPPQADARTKVTFGDAATVRTRAGSADLIGCLSVMMPAYDGDRYGRSVRPGMAANSLMPWADGQL